MTTPSQKQNEVRVLIFAPTGRDAELSAAFLLDSGMFSEICRDMSELIRRMEQGCGTILLAEEAMTQNSAQLLAGTLSRQPAWSEIPICIITSGGEITGDTYRRMGIFKMGGNVTVLERPFRPATLINTLQVAVRSRQRQYLVRDLLEERERAAAALVEQKRLYQSVTDNANVGLFIMDDRQHCVFMNPAAEQLTGFKLSEVQGRPLHDFVHHTHPDGRPYPLEECPIDQAFPEENQTRGEEVFVHKDGHFYNVAFTASPLRGATGKPYGTIIEVQDITERKRAEAALRISEERYRTLFESIDEGFCVIEVIFDSQQRPVDYRFIEINPAFERQSGLHDAQGKRMRELAPNHEEHWFQRYGKVALTGEPLRFEDGARALGRWFDVYAYRIGAAEERRVAVLFKDVTERKQAQEILERTVAERTAALQDINSQMEAFTYTIAHDLRAPLRAQQSFAQALLHDYKEHLDETGKEYARRIINSAIRLNDLVNDLLAFSRISRTELALERIELRPILCGLCSELAFQIQETNAQIQIEPFAFSVFGHNVTLRTSLGNVLSNALKFSKPKQPPQVRIWAEDLGKRVRLWIEDQGIGIAPEHHQQIFGIFHRLHKLGEFPGTGVGLAIVQKGIERMGGRVGVESEEGRGSRFWVELDKAD